MKTIESKQTAVITGAGTGIGYAVAERLLNDGFNVVLNGRSENKLKAAATQLGRADRIAISAGDITEPQTADRLIAESIQRFAGIDVLVNNAGIFAAKPLTDYTVEELDRYLGYLRGTFLLTQSAVRRMRIQGRGGAIVNISTILASRGVAAFPSSAPMAAKGGITALTQNLAVELAADDIRINAVAPGVVPTPLYGKTRPQFSQPSYRSMAAFSQAATARAGNRRGKNPSRPELREAAETAKEVSMNRRGLRHAAHTTDGAGLRICLPRLRFCS